MDWLNLFTWGWKFLLIVMIWGFVQGHLGFSPLVSMIVTGILGYILVFEHPFITSGVIILYYLLMMGLLFVLPSFIPMSVWKKLP